MKSVALYIVLLMAVIHVQAQYSLRNYSVKEGLPQSQVEVMLEDHFGYLWIGTYGGGLARFDGKEFRVYTTIDGLLSNIVTLLKLDSHNNLWIVHPRGITKFDGIHFKRFSQPEGDASIRRIRRIYESSDSIFFVSTPGYVGKVYNDSVYYWSKPIAPNKLVAYSHLLPDRNILLYLNDSTFVVKADRGDDVISHKGYFNRLQSIFNFKRDVWVKTDAGYFIFDVKGRSFTPASLQVKNHIISYDSLNDVFWTRNESYILKEQNRQNATIDTVFRETDINQVLNDSEGNTWFATSGSGLYKYFVQDFDRCSSENLKGVMSIHVDVNGSTWIGTSAKGLWRIKKGSIKHFSSSRFAYRNTINCIGESSAGEIWIGTNYGLGKFNSETDDFDWYTREQGLSHISVTSLSFDSQGGLWIGTLGGGLNYFDGQTFRPLSSQDGLRTNVISSCYYDSRSKYLYVGDEFGVCRIDSNRSIECLPIPAIENTLVQSIQPYKGKYLLIGSGGAGIIIYDPSNSTYKEVSSHDGLPSDFIYFAAADSTNNIWIGTEKGISKVRLGENLEIVENLHFDHENGLGGVEANQNAFYLGNDEKYFGLIDGLYQFNDVKSVSELPSFSTHLTSVELYYGEYDALRYANKFTPFYQVPVNPVFPFDRNHVTFNFNKVDKRYPKSVRFRYMLENFDKTWSRASSTNSAVYTNIPPGQYLFKVQATNSKGGWDDNILVYPFLVKAPFYQTSAFIFSVIVLLVGAILMVHYLRVKSKVDRTLLRERIRAQEQENLRKEIARDFHDEMGNQLSRIINYISLLKLNGNASSKVDLYTKVENSAKYLYTGTRDFIWAIDPVNDDLSKLFIHVRDFGEKLFEEKAINFRAYNDVRKNVKLAYGYSREANLIFKEVMTNSFKHSKANNVKLVFREEPEEFVIEFSDDGVGFDATDIKASNGLKNIRERAHRIHSRLQVSSSSTGTKISLYSTLKQKNRYDVTI